jgi:hypothetical protein
MKIVDKRGQSDERVKTAGEHARDLGSELIEQDTSIRSVSFVLPYVQEVFNTCIAVAEQEAYDEAMDNRYKGEEVRGAQRMAERIAKQLKALRG